MSEAKWWLVELGHGTERHTFRAFAPDEDAARVSAYRLWSESRLPYPQQAAEVSVLHESEVAPGLQDFLRGMGQVARKTTLLYIGINPGTSKDPTVSADRFEYPEAETGSNDDQTDLLAPHVTDLSEELVPAH